MTEHIPATQAMVSALARRIEALEQALEAAGIEIPKQKVPAKDQSRLDHYTGC